MDRATCVFLHVDGWSLADGGWEVNDLKASKSEEVSAVLPTYWGRLPAVGSPGGMQACLKNNRILCFKKLRSYGRQYS